MRVELDNLHLGTSPLTNRVYAGVKTRNGNEKIDITRDFDVAAINRFRAVPILTVQGKVYEITVTEKEITK